MTKLLNIDANAKTVKGQKQGYMTAVMYLAPFKAAGINVCPMAELAGCWQGCLNTAGRGGIAKGSKEFDTPAGPLPDNAIQRARIKRTRLWAEDRPAFFAQLIKEITAFEKRAKRKGLIPVVRLNGTSDIQWERMHVQANLAVFVNSTIFDLFPHIQFYDYTKIPKRFDRELPANYHLALSYSEASPRYAEMCWKAHNDHNASLVFVTSKARYDRTLTMHAADTQVIDGDAHDLRFTDPAGALVYLKAKGRARKDTSGFVLK